MSEIWTNEHQTIEQNGNGDNRASWWFKKTAHFHFRKLKLCDNGHLMICSLRCVTIRNAALNAVSFFKIRYRRAVMQLIISAAWQTQRHLYFHGVVSLGRTFRVIENIFFLVVVAIFTSANSIVSAWEPTIVGDAAVTGIWRCLVLGQIKLALTVARTIINASMAAK